MNVSVSIPRVIVAAALAATLASGCSWFRKGDGLYAESAENRPLEVPPDLDLPSAEGAMKLPPGAAAAASAPPAAAVGSASGFTVPGNRDAVFAKVGDALAAVQGLTVASRAQLLGTYDVNYEGADFLVRVTAVEAGVYVSAVDPRGLPATGDAPTKLMAALRSALGG